MPNKIPIPPKDIIEELYVKGKLTMDECCDELGIKSRITFKKWMKHYEIDARDVNELNSLEHKIGLTQEELKEKLYKMYHAERKSINKIAKEFGVSPTIITRRMEKFSIEKYSWMDAKTIFGSKENSGRWNNGENYTSHGYKMISVPEHPKADPRGYVYEHRLIMEKKIRRYLSTEEVVHHINENKLDNRIENLKLMSNSEHVRYHSVSRALKKGDGLSGL